MSPYRVDWSVLSGDDERSMLACRSGIQLQPIDLKCGFTLQG